MGKILDVLPHPAAPWYDRAIGEAGLKSLARSTPAARAAHARFVLSGAGGERNWHLRDLADWDPAALLPWADHVLGYDDEALAVIIGVDFTNYWRAGKGAGQGAIDALAARVHADPPLKDHIIGGAPLPVHARVELLIGTDNDTALAHLGELGRAQPIVRAICARRDVWVPAAGPAVRRYLRARSLIIDPASVEDQHEDEDVAPPAAHAALHQLLPIAEVLTDVRGLRCALPLDVVLALDLPALALAPLAGFAQRRLVFLTSHCEDCSANEEMRGYTWREDERGRCRFDEPREERCPGHQDAELDLTKYRRALALDHDGRFGPLGRAKAKGALGGWPHWAQAFSEVPECCGRPMFFVAETNASTVGGYDASLYGFVCECGHVAQVAQTT